MLPDERRTTGVVAFVAVIRMFGLFALLPVLSPYASHLDGATPLLIGLAVGAYGLTAAFLQIPLGALSDRIGRKNSIMLMTLLQGTIMLMTYHVFITFGLEAGFIIAAALIGFNFGGNFALFPAATADYFGNRNVGSNYGWVFTAYGVAGIAGPLLAGHFKDAAQGANMPVVWMTPFVIAGIACLFATAIVAFSGGPRRSPQLIAQDG